VSWQIVPRRMMELFASDDTAAAGRAQGAMLQMKKIEIAAIEAAFAG
jgi:predicted 3-demethylubiquinone-9 3-methyltransferase (glyoxalase superfamily)